MHAWPCNSELRLLSELQAASARLVERKSGSELRVEGPPRVKAEVPDSFLAWRRQHRFVGIGLLSRAASASINDDINVFRAGYSPVLPTSTLINAGRNVMRLTMQFCGKLDGKKSIFFFYLWVLHDFLELSVSLYGTLLPQADRKLVYCSAHWGC